MSHEDLVWMGASLSSVQTERMVLIDGQRLQHLFKEESSHKSPFRLNGIPCWL